MVKQLFSSCPMDCFDLCRFKVSVENNRIVKIEGDPRHPVTKGFICKKGKKLVSRFSHPDRLVHPLMKKNGAFVEISHDEAVDIIAEKLLSIKEKYGPRAVLNYVSDGYGGIKNNIQNIFFDWFGGSSRPVGSLCWAAGIAAQTYDFGVPRGHFPDDVLNSDLVIVWGRNPKFTSIHFYSLLKKAQKNGTRIIVIDPVKTATADAFDCHIRIRPSCDGALALAMCSFIIENNLCDREFIENHVTGFERFKAAVSEFTPEKAAQITGIGKETIEQLALDYAKADRASIYIGYGMQRYRNGGNNVRCIDALGAVTGKIGRKGCGVNYAAKSIYPFLARPRPETCGQRQCSREFAYGELGRFLRDANDPPVKAAFVAGGNPLNQVPDLETAVKYFAQIEFKVVFDHFMTDTARHADIVIPSASVFEQDDIFTTSMYCPVLNYSKKAVDPPENVIPEFEFYMMLAHKMGMKPGGFGFNDSKDYLEKSVAPLLENFGISLDRLYDEYFFIDDHYIAFRDRKFETPSGRIELYSFSAEKDGVSPLPCFIEPEKGKERFPLRLLTCHTDKSMHSQGFAFYDEKPVVRVNNKTAMKLGLENRSDVRVESESSGIDACLCIDDAVCDDTAFIYQGYWHKNGAVNFLTRPVLSDMGKQAAYYDSFCTIVNRK